MWTAFPSSDYYADSATPSTHQPASGLAGPPPAARRDGALPTFTMIRLTGSAAGCTPTAPPASTRSLPPATTPSVNEPGVERAAVNQSGIVAVDDPCPPGFGSLLKSRGFYHQFALALPFGLASTHAGVWQCRPAVTSSGTLHPQRAIPRPGRAPSFTGPLHQPGAGIPADTDEMCSSVISFRMAPRGAGSTCRASTTPRSSTPSTPAARRWSPYTARYESEGSTRPAAGKPRLPRRRSSSGSPARNPAASGSHSAPFIAKKRRTRRKRPAPIAERSTHAATWLSCASRRGCRISLSDDLHARFGATDLPRRRLRSP